ncbi:MAG: glycogen/starch/alpha-glucan phosphorylase [Coxiellaceae bacterium]|jgi:starch phosphorylase|nr:glycogen/starch/alpha-glucan phosphorylase [Coxiellaceae bacterium]
MFKKNQNHDTARVTPSVRVDVQTNSIKQAFLDNLAYLQGRFVPIASLNDYYMALAYTIRDHVMSNWTKTAKTYLEKESRTVCYLSAEFLLGPQLGNNLLNLGIYPQVKKAIEELGLDLDILLEQEAEPGLGNGGLGRLAACYMDSLATLNIPAIGYGIRYEFGIFNQEIRNGWQIENTDKWLRYGNPWEIARPEISFDIKFGGYTESYTDSNKRFQTRWIPDEVVKSIPYDIPIIGYKAATANFLRLWKAEACESFDFKAFNIGNYYGAVQEKVASENITKVLYPNDEPTVGKKLRLKQQYFFVSSSLQDMIRIYKQRGKFLGYFSDKYVIQLNDTHPAIGIAELMRLLIDDHQMGWETAWDITQKTFCYTNHTILPEALEKWPLSLFASILPRHLEIIFEINRRFLEQVRIKFNNDIARIKRMSIIEETGERQIRMANLACIGSYAINGVSKLHTELLKQEVLRDFYDFSPEKFSNKTNGITPRRFVLLINPNLANLINEAIGDGWIKNFFELRNLEKFVNDSAFIEQWFKIKYNNKKELAHFIAKKMGIIINPNSLFDIQAKRIHEYKRQHLNLLHVIAMYNRIRNNPKIDFVPRTAIFAGKAAPGYHKAKLIIKLINDIADVINNDIYVKDQLKVVFLPNYNVKNASLVYPAANLSEQISTAGKEASGTGNMKFAANGALTIGTLDGANVEMLEEIGQDNFFLFGLTANQVSDLKNKGYNPLNYINQDSELKAAIDLINSKHLVEDPALFKPLIDSLIYNDEFLVCADFKSYVACQNHASSIYRDKTQWTKMSILNTARIGKFSSDRAIHEYAEEIWNIKPVQI